MPLLNNKTYNIAICGKLEGKRAPCLVEIPSQKPRSDQVLEGLQSHPAKWSQEPQKAGLQCLPREIKSRQVTLLTDAFQPQSHGKVRRGAAQPPDKCEEGIRGTGGACPLPGSLFSPRRWLFRSHALSCSFPALRPLLLPHLLEPLGTS